MRRILATLVAATPLIGSDAFAYDVTVHNCTAERLRVITFDGDDLVTMIPYAEYEMGPLSAGLLSCNGRSACKVRVFFRDIGEEFRPDGTLYIHFSPLVGLYSRWLCQ